MLRRIFVVNRSNHRTARTSLEHLVTPTSLTAFVLALTLMAVKRSCRWNHLVPDDAAAVYQACVQECARQNTFFRFLTLIPDHFKFSLVNRMIVYGYPQHVALRKKVVEELARSKIADGIRQIVVLGAGFDALSLRLSKQFPTLKFLELDLLATQILKRRSLIRARLAIPANLDFCPCDLSQTSLDEVLATHSHFEVNADTLFVAEGLSMYLTKDENRQWLKATQHSARKSSCLVFTALEAPLFATTLGPRISEYILKRSNERYRFSSSAQAMDSFLMECGYDLKHCHTFQQLQHAYLTPDEYSKQLTINMGSSLEHLYFAVSDRN